MKRAILISTILISIIMAALLASCGLSDEAIRATEAQIARDIYATQTAEAPPPTATFTPTFTPPHPQPHSRLLPPLLLHPRPLPPSGLAANTI